MNQHCQNHSHHLSNKLSLPFLVKLWFLLSSLTLVAIDSGKFYENLIFFSKKRIFTQKNRMLMNFT